MSDTIRIAGADDVPALYALLQQAYAPLVQQGVHFTITRSPLGLVADTVASQTSFVLERENAAGERVLAATATVRFPWTPAPQRRSSSPFLHWFAVAPAFKRQGLGNRLLDHVESRFLGEQLKAGALHLATAVEHPWLPRYYEARGYRPFDRSVNALGTPLVWLEKNLGTAGQDSAQATQAA
ncbi:GNAT family N-acetyltransferase [Burkholderia gladioli]|uniref:GNAT family N-acetyltransferase n=1 Tax=Burkholderia gladioli TaxID=28095 RepID=UPI00163ECB8A|nr:GNAT family N-acetyltransferase [Burkholderia gladioli]